MYLGIEIGGTKLQLAVGAGDGTPPVALQRHDVQPVRGAAGILEQIQSSGTALLQKHDVAGIGIGFGGPIDAARGRVIKSHQIDGWEDVALASWCETTLGIPAVIGNDCDLAALAEARHGAGQGSGIVFFVTVGTGVGGGLVVDGHLHGAQRPAVAEIGHLRPGLHCDRPDMTVESLASGWGIAATCRARFSDEVSHALDRLRSTANKGDILQIRQRLDDAREEEREYLADLWQRCGGELNNLTARHVAQAAEAGNEVARGVLTHAVEALGWAIAQTITLTAAEVVVIGGGVSLIGEQLFFAPLRSEIQRYVFPPLHGRYQVLPAKMGELVVVQGALALAANTAT